MKKSRRIVFTGEREKIEIREEIMDKSNILCKAYNNPLHKNIGKLEESDFISIKMGGYIIPITDKNGMIIDCKNAWTNVENLEAKQFALKRMIERNND